MTRLLLRIERVVVDLGSGLAPDAAPWAVEPDAALGGLLGGAVQRHLADLVESADSRRSDDWSRPVALHRVAIRSNGSTVADVGRAVAGAVYETIAGSHAPSPSSSSGGEPR